VRSDRSTSVNLRASWVPAITGSAHVVLKQTTYESLESQSRLARLRRALCDILWRWARPRAL
jgi:hypothetical protein